MCEDFLLPMLRWLGFKDVGLGKGGLGVRIDYE